MAWHTVIALWPTREYGYRFFPRGRLAYAPTSTTTGGVRRIACIQRWALAVPCSTSGLPARAVNSLDEPVPLGGSLSFPIPSESSVGFVSCSAFSYLMVRALALRGFSLDATRRPELRPSVKAFLGQNHQDIQCWAKMLCAYLSAPYFPMPGDIHFVVQASASELMQVFASTTASESLL